MKAQRSRVRTVLTLIVGAFAISAALGWAEDPIRVTQAVNATDHDLNPARMYAAPFMAVDPANPDNVVAVAANIRDRTCGLVRSRDGGQSWEQPDALPTHDDYPFCFATETGPPQAVVAFGRNGALYYAYDGYDNDDTFSDWPRGGTGGGGKWNVSVLVSRSSDMGDSWETALVRNARGLEGDDQENHRPLSAIAVDTTSGPQDVVYVGWKVSYRDGGRQQVLFAVSSDGGKTFSEPIDLTGGYFEDHANRRRLAEGARMDEVPDSDEVIYYWPDFTVDDDGTFYAVWTARFGGGPQMDRTGAFLTRSSDGGQTLTVTELSPAPETYRYPMIAWSPHGGPEGSLHLAYEAETPQEVQWVHDIYHERSTDGGATWSEATRLNDDDPDDLVGQYHPYLVVAPNGRVDVSWWDFRHDNGNFANDVYMASSHDHGVTWSDNIRVTDASISRRIGVWYGNADIRQAPGMVASHEVTTLAWDDTRNGDDATHTQDIYSATVQFSPVGAAGLPAAAQYGLAVCVGLGLVGVVFLLLAAAFKGRAQPASTPAEREVATD